MNQDSDFKTFFIFINEKLKIGNGVMRTNMV
jgi:hypothetical protein